MPAPRISHIDHFVLTVADINRAAAFYTEVLGMRMEVFSPDDCSKRVALKFGRQKINLHEAGSEFVPNAGNATPGSADYCLLSSGPITDWLEHLTKVGVQIEEGPVSRTGALGKIRSIYLRDPDGNLVEISEIEA